MSIVDSELLELAPLAGLTAPVVVTTPHSPKPGDGVAARAAALRLGLPFTIRGRRRLERLCEEEHVVAALVVGTTRWTIRAPDCADLDFHCSSGVLRIRGAEGGIVDPLVRALGLQPGLVVVDATAGQCADALFIAYAVRPTGRVIAVESAPAMYGLLDWGVTNFRRGEPPVDDALDRIQVVPGDFRDYLASLPEKSVDVVYFDPMFRTRAASNRNFDTLRRIADPRPITRADLELAASRARSRVVVKDHRSAEEVSRLGLDLFEDIRSSTKVQYGVMML